MKRRAPIKKGSDQVKEYLDRGPDMKRKINKPLISTGSTLLDCCISGRVIRGGGIPPGILVEVFGPSGCGKSGLLCEIAGSVGRLKGDFLFMDPEARLNRSYAEIYGVTIQDEDYSRPATPAEVFGSVRKWKPKGKKVNGIFADSLAALTTEEEMEDKDAYGGQRAKQFSKQLRMTCRILADNNYIMVCSNQVRDNFGGGPYGPKDISTGGRAIAFYASIRLQCSSPKPLTKTVRNITQAFGVSTKIKVAKSSIDIPLRETIVYFLFNYGIDDIRGNLQYLKDIRGLKTYQLGKEKINISLDKACKIIERNNLEEDLRNEVIDLWLEIQEQFDINRKKKRR